MQHVVTTQRSLRGIPMCDLTMGQIAVICPGEDHEGEVVMRTYSGFVSLSSPTVTWSYPNKTRPGILVNPVPQGDVVTIHVGGESDD